MLLNAAKCQGCSYYHFWIIKGKPTREGVKIPPFLFPPRLNGLNVSLLISNATLLSEFFFQQSDLRSRIGEKRNDVWYP